MKQIFEESFKNEMRVAAMTKAFRRLQFYSFEVRTFGVIRVGIILLSGFLVTLASIRSNSPIPLFVLLAIIVQSFVGSLFPRHGTTPNLANPSLALPLLTLAALLHFGASFLWTRYREELGQRIAVWFCIVTMSITLIQFAYSTLCIYLRGKTTSEVIRWTYAVISLIVMVFYLTASRTAQFSHEVHEVFVPALQYIEAFLRIDYVLVGGFCVLVFAEGLHAWWKVPSVWGPKHYYAPIGYPDQDVDDSFFKSIPRDARLRLLDLAEWISVQMRNLYRLVHGVLTGFRALLSEIKVSAVRYGKAGLSACLLLISHLLPLGLVALALFLAYRSATSISTQEGQFFVLIFYFYIFGAACVLLIAYLTYYYLFAGEIARHFRHSFFAFVHFGVLVGMFIGAGLWSLVGTQFAPGLTVVLAVVVYSALGISIYVNRSEMFEAIFLGFSKRLSGANQVDGTGQNHHQGASNTVSSHSYNPSYWLFFLMIVLAASVASKQWLNDTMTAAELQATRDATASGERARRKSEEVRARREAEERTRAEAIRKSEEARKSEEVRARREAEERTRAEAMRKSEEARKSEEVRARREAEERTRAEAIRKSEEARKSEEVRARREAEERTRAEAIRKSEEARKSEEVRARREAEERTRAEAIRKSEEARKSEEVRARREAEERTRAEAIRKSEEARKSEEVRARREAEERTRAEAIRKSEEARKSEEVRARREAKEAKQLPSCPGLYTNATWTNCLGEFTSRSGQKYVGEFRDGKRHGQGTYMWPSGAKYVGEFRDGKRHGQGTYMWPSGNKYVGEFRDDKRHGQGTYMLPNGTKYVGEFRDDKFHGQGTYMWPNGTKYVGEFRDDKFHGQGTQYRADGTILQTGVWENDVRLGDR